MAEASSPSSQASPPPAPKASGRHTRAARAAGWVRARKWVQYLTLIAFFLLFLWSRQDGWPNNVINLPMRLDPLLALSHLIAGRLLLAGSALALITLVVTLVFGRAWCGWLCPLGTTLQLAGVHQKKDSRAAPHPSWRSVKYVLLIAILAAAVFGNLTLLVLDPLTILMRTLAVSIWPAVNNAITWVEATLYPVPALSEPISAADSWLRPAILPSGQFYYRDALLFAALFASVLALDVVASRFWCRYLCPLGGMLGLLSKVALFRRRLTQDCKGCTLCTDICPTGTIDPAKGYVSDPGECTMCLECMEACPRDITTFSPTVSIAQWNEYDPGRRQALVTMGTAIAAVALFRADALAARGAPTLLRPPGVRETNSDSIAFTTCTRCSECIRVCPTGGLQPAVMEAGVEGFGTPVLMPRLGYCDYSCNACGQVCPVEAIPALRLEEKRTQLIGKAYIDEDRCIAWSDRLPCIVCQEMCPLPEKAIQLEETRIWGRDGIRVDLQLPHVVRDLCIGCGICEFKCPVRGEAAIRVYSDEAGRQL